MERHEIDLVLPVKTGTAGTTTTLTRDAHHVGCDTDVDEGDTSYPALLVHAM